MKNGNKLLWSLRRRRRHEDRLHLRLRLQPRVFGHAQGPDIGRRGARRRRHDSARESPPACSRRASRPIRPRAIRRRGAAGPAAGRSTPATTSARPRAARPAPTTGSRIARARKPSAAPICTRSSARRWLSRSVSAARPGPTASSPGFRYLRLRHSAAALPAGTHRPVRESAGPVGQGLADADRQRDQRRGRRRCHARARHRQRQDLAALGRERKSRASAGGGYSGSAHRASGGDAIGPTARHRKPGRSA